MRMRKRIMIIMLVISILTVNLVLAHTAIYTRYLINKDTLEFDYQIVESDNGMMNKMANHKEAKEFNSDELSVNKYGIMTKFDEDEADRQGEPWNLDKESPFPDEYFNLDKSLYGKTLDKDLFEGGSLGSDKNDRKISDQGFIKVDGSGEMLINTYPPEYLKVDGIKNDISNSLSDPHRMRAEYNAMTVVTHLNSLISYLTYGKGFEDFDEMKKVMRNFVKENGKEQSFQYNGENVNFFIGKPNGEIYSSVKERKAEDLDQNYTPHVNNKGEVFWYIWRGDKHLSELKEDEFLRIVMQVPKGYLPALINGEEQRIIDQKQFIYTRDTVYVDARQVIEEALVRMEVKGDTSTFVAVEDEDGHFVFDFLAKLVLMLASLITKFIGPMDAKQILTSGTEDGFSIFFTPQVFGFMMKIMAFILGIYVTVKSFLLAVGVLIARLKNKDNPNATANYMDGVLYSFKGVIYMAIGIPIIMTLLMIGNALVMAALWFFANEIAYLDNSISRIGFFFLSMYFFFRYLFRTQEIVAQGTIMNFVTSIRVELEKNDSAWFDWMRTNFRLSLMPVSDTLIIVLVYGVTMLVPGLNTTARFIIAPFMTFTMIKVLDKKIYKEDNETQGASEQAAHTTSSGIKGAVGVAGAGMVAAGNASKGLADKIEVPKGDGDTSIATSGGIKRNNAHSINRNQETYKQDKAMKKKRNLNIAGSALRYAGEATQGFKGSLNVADGLTYMDPGKIQNGFKDIGAAGKQSFKNFKDDRKPMADHFAPDAGFEDVNESIKTGGTGVSNGHILKEDGHTGWIDAEMSKNTGLSVTGYSTMQYDMSKVSSDLKDRLNQFDHMYKKNRANGRGQEFLLKNGVTAYRADENTRKFRFNEQGLNSLGYKSIEKDTLGDRKAYKLERTDEGYKNGTRAFLNDIKDVGHNPYRREA